MKAKIDSNGDRIQNIAQVYYGSEPKWTLPYVGQVLTSKIGDAINWYSVTNNNSDFKSWVLKYFKANNFATNFADDVYEPDFRALGLLIRMKERGCVFDDYWQARFEVELKKLKIRVKTDKSSDVAEKSKYEKIQATMKKRASNTMAIVEELLDRIMLGGVKIDKTTTWESLRIVIPTAYMSDVYDCLDSHLAELEDVMEAFDSKSKTPEQEFLVESYSNFTRTKLIVYINSLQHLQDLCESSVKKVETEKVTAKKPKEKKPINLDKLVEFFGYQKNMKEFGIISPSPKKIHGADQVIIYNTEKRIISILKGGPEGLSIKSTTITGIDEKNSIRKSVRKPEVFIPLIMKASKPQAKNLIKELVAKEQPVSGRTNNETVIIRID